ncbi:MAG: DNA polymerase III subunit beta [Chloroflexi bacterium]|nr:DNA polymerase III subunit beta [Chloroflexota bacterium]
MEFTIEQPALARALRLVGRAVPARSTNPIAQTILVEAGPGQVRLTATDLEMALSTEVVAEVVVPGCAAVPGRLLGEYVAQLPAAPLRLCLDAAKRRLQLQCLRFRAEMATVDPTAFPRPTHAGDGFSVSLDSGRLQAAIRRVAFAAARDTSRPVLTGVLFAFDLGGLTLVAADGFRLARARLGEGGRPDCQLLVPAKAVVELGRLLEEAPSACLLVDGEGRGLCVQLGETRLFSRLLEGSFPDVARVVPAEWRTRLTVETAAFRQAMRVAGLFGESGEARPVLLEAKPNEVRLHARGDQSGEAEVELPAAHEGEPQSVLLNTRLLGDILDAATGPRLEVSWLTPQSPVVFKETSGVDAGDLWLAMPLHNPAINRPATEAA